MWWPATDDVEEVERGCFNRGWLAGLMDKPVKKGRETFLYYEKE